MARKYTACDVAHWIVANIDRDAGDSITHLKLQKLTYYAQAWALVILGRPLFDEDFQAWAHGPVVESVFREYRSFGWDALPCPDEVPDFDDEDSELLANVVDVYGDLSAKHLERMTHAEDPWRDARGNLPPEARSNAVIPKSRIKEYYKSLYEKTDNGQASKSAS